ncbi:MAG TPA: UDP-N-acetylmuramate dehydrogenase [Aeromicrobium sp.]|nr:UDP-N-acetylmuramate dehydrogenase [Aeromicrobium sp.]
MDFAELTTLRLGGPARTILEVTTETDLVDAVRVADEAGDPVLIVGGGSNLVVSDAGFDGTVILVRTRGVSVQSDDCDDLAALCGGVMVTVQAGEDWDDLVARAVAENWRGFEALSGIPGTVGATPIQNVGAYGQEVSQTVARVRVYDRYDRVVRTMALADCGFGYRTSRFKQSAPRYVVLTVAFQLAHGDHGQPIAYAQLAEALGVDVGAVVPSADVRAAVLELRRSKGMVLDPDDHDTWSAGSFFTNPVLDATTAATLPAEAPRYPQPDGSIKTSAAWLIERAGYGRGFPGAEGQVSVSTKHALALTNRGGATTSELIDLARELRAGVQNRFGITLDPEPTLIGCSL